MPVWLFVGFGGTSIPAFRACSLNRAVARKACYRRNILAISGVTMRACTFLLAVIIWTSPAGWPLMVWAQTMPCAAEQGKAGRGPFRRVPHDEPEEGCTDAAPQAAQRTQLSRETFLQLDKDSTELLRLATELKRMVGQSNQQVLSLDIASRAERMEKLSKSIKNRIRRGY
jgi:hypothetical protein